MWEASFEELQERSWRAHLRGFVPDQDANISRIADWIEGSCAADGSERAVVLAFDSVGYRLAVQALERFSITTYSLGCATSVFPTTSTAAWTSIIYGTLPSVHGIYGPVFYSSELGAVIGLLNSVRYHSHDHKERLDLNEIDRVDLSFGKMTIFERLSLAGWKSHYIADSAHILAYLWSRELVRGADAVIVPLKAHQYLDIDALVGHCLMGLTRSVEKEVLQLPTLHWLYINLDPLAHFGGLDVAAFSRVIDHLMTGILEILHTNLRRTSVMMVSDHGHVRQEVPPTRRRQYNDLLKASRIHRFPQGGAGRTRWIYPHQEALAEACKLVSRTVGPEGIVLQKGDPELGELLSAGWSSSIAHDERLGELVSVATGPGFPSASPDLAAEHGGISAQEMFVPVVRFRFS
jgi:type I phosphodiesterase/nucleotide pyrophosphatase